MLSLPANCPFLLYSVIASKGQPISPPNFPMNCSWLFVYGESRPSPGWTRVRADHLTPEYTKDLRGDRRTSRVLKINSHLLNVSAPVVYIDTKHKVGNLANVYYIIKAMRECNASMLSFLHPSRPHDVVLELKAIVKKRRTSNASEIRRQESNVRNDPLLSRLDATRATTVNDGSMIVRIASPELEAFEREWYRTYNAGGDRDQPAFAIAHAKTFGDLRSDLCGNAVWTVPHKGIQSRHIDGHNRFIH